MPELTIIISGHPPKELSPNAGKNINFHKITRLKNEWQETVAWAIAAAGGTYAKTNGKAWVMPEMAHMTIERVIDGVKTKPMDGDNLAGLFKTTRDVLKPNGKTNPYGMGIIRNDDPGHLKAEYIQRIDRTANAQTIITVRSL